MTNKLRKLFTNTEILDAIESTDTYGDAARQLSNLREQEVSRQLVNYWHRTLVEFTKTNGEPYVGTTVADRHIREEELELRTPSPHDYDAVREIPHDNSCILVVPDQHAPYHHPDALDFLVAVAAKYRPTRVINLGDEVDNHALSFHDSDPNLDSAGTELVRAQRFVHQLASIFPYQEVCHSNHGSLVYRRALKSGIPVEYIKSYRDILFPEGGGDGWSWHDVIRTTLPNGQVVQFQHQVVGDFMANASHERCSLVLGHEHGRFEIDHRASKAALYWGMYSGCLIDSKSLAFAYGKLFPKKPIIGCSVIIDSQPILIPMLLNSEGRWVGQLGGIASA